MTSISQVCLYLRAIARYSSGLILVGSILGCSEQPAEQTPTATQSIPPLGAKSTQAAPLSLSVRIDLAAIKDQVASDAKVYVFVREPGERMPLGVEHFTVETLPAEVGFSTTNNYPVVSVIARVSPSGKVEKSPGDIERSVLTNFAHPTQIVDLSFSDKPSPGSKPTATTPKGSKSISIKLDLQVPQDELSKLTEHARVFIIAKAPGSPVPLAVKAYPVNAVPKQLVLSDNDAMMPSRPLSSAKKLEVSARLSRTGDVSRDTGDWEGIALVPDLARPNQYTILLNQRIE